MPVSKTPDHDTLLERKLTLNLRGVMLEQAILAINKASSIDITFSRDVVPVTTRVTVVSKAITAMDALNVVLHGTSIYAKVSSPNQITLIRRMEPAAPKQAVDTATNPAHVLDRVVVTGTTGPTTQAAVPVAMIVIGSDQIEKQNISNLSQLFRGNVPGFFALNTFASDALGKTEIFSRGATSLGTSAKIKTYVDGIELVNPAYIGQIDVNTIDRIEILPGPQASTIYGSGALSGVIQIFTKKGRQGKPHLRGSLLTGLIHSQDGGGYTPRHDHALQVDGGEGNLSYSVGASHSYIGPWFPAYSSRIVRASGGARLQRGLLILESSARHANSKLTSLDSYIDASRFEQQATGILRYTLPPSPDGWKRNKVRQATYGVAVTYSPWAFWTHNLTIGQDHTGSEEGVGGPAYFTPSDSLQELVNITTKRPSIAYNNTIDWYITPQLRSTWTLGLDRWRILFNESDIVGPSTTGSFSGDAVNVTRLDDKNRGYFAQNQLSIGSSFFLTTGIRIEDNTSYGNDYGTSYSPRVGISYLINTGKITSKVRAAYGKATRPPEPGSTSAQFAMSPTGVGLYKFILEAPQLGPEIQKGGEVGIELYIPNSTFQATYYSQVVDDIIINVRADSVPFTLPGDQVIFAPQLQLRNTGAIKNSGLELQGTSNYGPFILQGHFNWRSSRVHRLADRVSTTVRVGDSFKAIPKHANNISLTYSKPRHSITLSTSYTGSTLAANTLATFIRQTARLPLTARRMGVIPGDITSPAYQNVDLNLTQQVSNKFDVIMSVLNLTEHSGKDGDIALPIPGRAISLGVRLK